MNMKNALPRKEVLIAVAMAIVVSVAVVVAKQEGWNTAAEWIAGVGTAVTAGYVLLTNIAIGQVGRKKPHK